MNDGNGRFTESNQGFGYGGRPGEAADINGNESVDLIISSVPDSTHQIHLYVNDGHADFGTPTVIDEGIHASQLLVIDLDSDGDIDLISMWGFVMQVYLNQPAP